VPAIDVKRRFGESLRDWRNHLGISQEELAEKADLHRTYISDVERGARNLSLESITKLATALNISVAALFPWEFQNQKTGVLGGTGKNLVDILLVEDNPDDVALTVHAFKKARFANRLTVVRDGAEALDFLFGQGEYTGRSPSDSPQIILLDLDLPKVIGLEVLRRIKADKRTQMIPVVIMTMSEDQYTMAECRRLGAENYIVKPVNFQSFSLATPQLNLNWALVKPPEPVALLRAVRA
jgi:CheY-like chemotaxis protein/DNA-binding XRE family transcriptional regulator